MSDNLKTTATIITSMLVGFIIAELGSTHLPSALKTSTIQKIEVPSIVKFKKIIGDEIYLETLGNIKVIWPGQHVIENEEHIQIPLGQIPDENDLKLREFPYVGNAKTRKFYPSYTYPARGTSLKYRRLFLSKQDALDNGFVASKLVK